MTQMATTLGDSYIKFIGDYFFAANAETKLRNPTKVIWKGFNRWTRAVNWTMVIPVPYTPGDWEPMHALKILNTSYMVGISDCIWQLGTDFGVSRAEDYVAELKTFNLMVESFKSYVDDWQIMGADISSGSTADETRQYIEISQDLNSALGWTESTALTSSNIGKNFINENDPALKVLLSSNLPIWLTLPYKAKSKQKSNIIVVDDVADAMRWAQMMGDAASTGFDAIFKHISLYELENPTNSFYVTALFKKVMGSRVFPSRPLHLFGNSNKLYTHCANSVSGGIAFMVINTEETENSLY
ncbi:uncharacterized protein LOC119676719 [Teleopsis dalmanni]|uniref:uncharacterized protein LOC119676719 n=1 Tax=Teleopsis dalmanni TaxID=139649 RepID=UPI0018CFBA1E|nr:uncharacterized protein LOC119676719 [Teleopsis dalmanni]